MSHAAGSSVMRLASVNERGSKMDNMKAIDIVEGVYDDAEDHEVIAAWQHLIDTGLVWQLQGFFGRQAARLIEDGVCTP